MIELIEAIKNNDDINEHALSEETEHQDWFNQAPNEVQTITLEVPTINFPSKTDDRLTKGIPCKNKSSKFEFNLFLFIVLGRIFKRVGANSVSKQLDINNKNLAIQIASELVINNTNLSNDELQLLIELYLDKKRENGLKKNLTLELLNNRAFCLDSSIDWIEFRDLFLPMVSNGYYSKINIKKWFELIDTHEHGIITTEQ